MNIKLCLQLLPVIVILSFCLVFQYTIIAINKKQVFIIMLLTLIRIVIIICSKYLFMLNMLDLKDLVNHVNNERNIQLHYVTNINYINNHMNQHSLQHSINMLNQINNNLMNQRTNNLRQINVLQNTLQNNQNNYRQLQIRYILQSGHNRNLREQLNQQLELNNNLNNRNIRYLNENAELQHRLQHSINGNIIPDDIKVDCANYNAYVNSDLLLIVLHSSTVIIPSGYIVSGQEYPLNWNTQYYTVYSTNDYVVISSKPTINVLSSHFSYDQQKYLMCTYRQITLFKHTMLIRKQLGYTVSINIVDSHLFLQSLGKISTLELSPQSFLRFSVWFNAYSKDITPNILFVMYDHISSIRSEKYLGLIWSILPRTLSMSTSYSYSDHNYSVYTYSNFVKNMWTIIKWSAAASLIYGFYYRDNIIKSISSENNNDLHLAKMYTNNGNSNQLIIERPLLKFAKKILHNKIASMKMKALVSLPYLANQIYKIYKLHVQLRDTPITINIKKAELPTNSIYKYCVEYPLNILYNIGGVIAYYIRHLSYSTVKLYLKRNANVFKHIAIWTTAFITTILTINTIQRYSDDKLTPIPATKISSLCMTFSRNDAVVIKAGFICPQCFGACIQPPKTQIYIGAPCISRYLSIAASCEHNVSYALMYRQARSFNVRRPRVFVELCRAQVSLWNDYLVDTLMSTLSWIEKHNGPKKRLYRLALIQLAAGAPIEYVIKAFVKREIMFGKVSRNDGYYTDERYAPRVITSHDPRMTVHVGPVFHTVYEKLKEIFNGQSPIEPNIWYTSGMNKNQLGDLVHHIESLTIGGIWMMSDFSKFDAHITMEHLQAELEMMMYILGNVQGENSVSDLMLTYYRNGFTSLGQERMTYALTRASGDPDTGFGNSFIAQAAHLIVLNHFFDAKQLRTNGDIYMVFCGDDFIIRFSAACPKPNMQVYETIMKDECGFESSPRYVRDAHLKYCSNVFVPAIVNGRETYIATQLPFKNLSKAYASHKNTVVKRLQAWVYAQSDTYQKDFHHIPFMFDFHNMVHRAYSGVQKVDYVSDDDEPYAMKHVAIAGQPSLLFDAWFVQRYGVPPPNFHGMSMNALNLYINNHGLITQCCEFDIADPPPYLIPAAVYANRSVFRVIQMNRVVTAHQNFVDASGNIVNWAPITAATLDLCKGYANLDRKMNDYAQFLLSQGQDPYEINEMVEAYNQMMNVTQRAKALKNSQPTFRSIQRILQEQLVQPPALIADMIDGWHQ
jgi:hypothetical protein